MPPHTTRHKNVLRAIYTLVFISSLSVALPAYINSSFISLFAPERFLGMLYTCASLITIAGLIVMPHVLKRLGVFRTSVLVIGIEILLLFALAYVSRRVLVLPLFVLIQAVIPLWWFSNDVLLETFSDNAHAGTIRGLALSITNAAWVLAPLLTSALIVSGDFRTVYIVSACALLTMLPLYVVKFAHYTDIPYHHHDIKKTLRVMWARKDLHTIFVARTLLFFFFSWMVIYTPLYLFNHLGFEWGPIGALLSIALLPYILLEYPLGHLADSRWGEKEIMILGFGIIAFSTLLLSSVTTASFGMWAFLLFMTRVGAAMVESMVEIYFFKKIRAEDSDILSVFRMAEPVAYVISPVIASFFLLFISIRFLFVPLALLMASGIFFAHRLTDTN